jgi:MlaD protein
MRAFHYSSRDKAAAAAAGLALSYFVEFPEGAGGMARGAPVTLGGRPVGRVESIGLPSEKKSGSFSTPVEISISALALGVHAGASKTELQNALNKKLASLIENGLRAKISPAVCCPENPSNSRSSAGRRRQSSISNTSRRLFPRRPQPHDGECLPAALLFG